MHAIALRSSFDSSSLCGLYKIYICEKIGHMHDEACTVELSMMATVDQCIYGIDEGAKDRVSRSAELHDLFRNSLAAIDTLFAA